MRGSGVDSSLRVGVRVGGPRTCDGGGHAGLQALDLRGHQLPKPVLQTSRGHGHEVKLQVLQTAKGMGRTEASARAGGAQPQEVGR